MFQHSPTHRPANDSFSSCLQRFLFLLACITCSPTLAADFDSIDLYPPTIHLSSVRDFQNVLVIARSPDGITKDVTAEAEISVSDTEIAQIIDRSRVQPVADGEAVLKVTWNGKTAESPIQSLNAKTRPPLDFRLDVVPVFTRSGCNSGTCHGSSRGKDGFRLSLFGFDPKGDYQRVTRELASRRINLAVPAASLLLEKSIGAVAHTGGKRFERDSIPYQLLEEWIRGGAVDTPEGSDPKKPVTVDRVELFPPQVVIQGIGQKQKLLAVAFYSDGTDRDVSDLAVFLSNDEGVAEIDEHGIVAAGSRGEAFLTARFETHTVGVPATILPEGLDVVETTGPPPEHYIDRLVESKLRTLRVPASGSCNDDEFLRRVTVDTIGLLPTEEEYSEFVADKSPEKRRRKTEQLLDNEAFGDLWGSKWADLLMVRAVNNRVYDKGVIRYSEWLREQFKSGVPLDEIARKLLTATGHAFTEPEVNFYAREQNKLKVAEDVAQIFLGIRTQCAQCHNHPFDRWTMDDYYGFAAFFARIGNKRHEDYRQLIIFESGGGETRHPVTKQSVPPKFLGGENPEIERGKERREAVADWLTSPDNPWFARTAANRIWAHYMGRGIIHPVDDVRVSNPPSNAELLDALAAKLIEYKYDFRRLALDIMTSDTYQRTSKSLAGNEHDNKNFSHATVRRIPAATLIDCLSQVTDSPTKFSRQPLGTRAVQAPTATGNYFLKTFGGSDRTSACACSESTEPTLSQALHMLNGESVHGKIVRGRVVANAIAAKKPTAEIVDTIYQRALCRKATDEERQRLVALVEKDEKTKNAALEDVFWAVLNSREFLFLK